VLGIDLSPALAQTAARLAADDGLRDRVEFRAGDSRRLDVGDGVFDAVVAHTLLSHVDDPLTFVREAARLVRPDGMIGIFDGDYASTTFGHADPVKGKVYDDAIISGLVTSPRVMRRLPRLLQAAGLQPVASFSYILAEMGKADFWAPAIESFRRLVPKSGTMTQQEADAWAEGLRLDSEAGVFFGASNYYGYVARRPKS
jgi:SAM-dependent methyltransferase